MPDTPAIECPKCAAPMRRLQTDTYAVDRCEKCYGIWLDKGERVKMTTDKKLAGVVDIGSEEVGHAKDEITDINCPRCGEHMLHVAHPAQAHVGFETCPKCEGSFFDAGELRDLSEFTISERIRALLGRPTG